MCARGRAGDDVVQPYERVDEQLRRHRQRARSPLRQRIVQEGALTADPRVPDTIAALQPDLDERVVDEPPRLWIEIGGGGAHGVT